MITRTLVWHSEFYNSEENCKVLDMNNGDFSVTSLIVNRKDDFSVSYYLVGKHDKVSHCEIRVNRNGLITEFILEMISGNWLLNGEIKREFEECTDIDISCTPFTNSLPINRMKLPVGGDTMISVIFLDLETLGVSVKSQKYIHLGNSKYRFETVPKDFEAIVSMNTDGYVTSYEGLFLLERYTSTKDVLL